MRPSSPTCPTSIIPTAGWPAGRPITMSSRPPTSTARAPTPTRPPPGPSSPPPPAQLHDGRRPDPDELARGPHRLACADANQFVECRDWHQLGECAEFKYD